MKQLKASGVKPCQAFLLKKQYGLLVFISLGQIQDARIDVILRPDVPIMSND